MIVFGPALALSALWLVGALALQVLGARRGGGPETLVMDFVAGVVILATTGMTTIALGGRIGLAPIYLLVLGLGTVTLWQRHSRGSLALPTWHWRLPLFRHRPTGPRRHASGSPGEWVAEPPSTDSTGPGTSARISGERTLRVPGSAAHNPLPRAYLAPALLAGAALLLLVIAISASQDRLAWDGWAFWTLKARILFFEGTLPSAALDPAGPYPYAHPEYPLAVPLVDWWLFRHTGTPTPVLALASLAGALWFATLPPLVWAALRPRLDETTAALATLGIAAFWPLAFYATGGYADIVIALALLGAVIEIERLRRGEDRLGKVHALGGLSRQVPGDLPAEVSEPGPEPATGAAIRLATYLALAALAKNEGLALALVGAAIALACGPRGGARQVRRLMPLLYPFAALLPWFVLTRLLGLVPQHLDGAAPSLGETLARVPTITAALLRLLLSRAWIPLPFLTLAGLYAALRRGRLHAPAGWAIVAGYTASIGVVYLTTALDLEWLLSTSLDRMVGDLVPAIVVLSLREIWSDPQSES